jgi:hypothetical protein
MLWAIVIEGAVDRFVGRPREHNPYGGGYDSREAWAFGWDEADWLLDVRGQQEARRWLEEAA